MVTANNKTGYSMNCHLMYRTEGRAAAISCCSDGLIELSLNADNSKASASFPSWLPYFSSLSSDVLNASSNRPSSPGAECMRNDERARVTLLVSKASRA